MINFLDELKASEDIVVERQIVCYSISNNAVPALKIRHKEYTEGKKIVVMGRQHPGETVGSFAFEGFINKMIGEEKRLKQYEIIAIPMVNPDGVVYGNFRTNLGGYDLNRQWQEPDRGLQP
jgi:murein tripeptide amidase MpaA